MLTIEQICARLVDLGVTPDQAAEGVRAILASRPGAISAPALTTAAAILAEARAKGIPAFPPDPITGTKILLGSLALDLGDAAIRQQLLELNRRSEITLVRIDTPAEVRASLVQRGLNDELVDASEISDRTSTFHALLLPPAEPELAPWRTDTPPRGVRCLVTATNSRGAPYVIVASMSPDDDGAAWSSQGKALSRVIAWMPAPAPAEIAVAKPSAPSGGAS